MSGREAGIGAKAEIGEELLNERDEPIKRERAAARMSAQRLGFDTRIILKKNI